MAIVCRHVYVGRSRHRGPIDRAIDQTIELSDNRANKRWKERSIERTMDRAIHWSYDLWSVSSGLWRVNCEGFSALFSGHPWSLWRSSLGCMRAFSAGYRALGSHPQAKWRSKSSKKHPVNDGHTWVFELECLPTESKIRLGCRNKYFSTRFIWSEATMRWRLGAKFTLCI